MRTRGAFALLLGLLLLGLFSVSSQPTDRNGFSTCQATTTTPLSAYENVTTHEGDLIISGTQTFAIENCTYIQTGNVDVRDWGKLVLRDAELQINQTSLDQYSFYVRDSASFELEDARITSGEGIWLDFSDYCVAKLVNATLNFGAFYQMHFSGHSIATIQRLTLLGVHGVQFHSQCDVTIENSAIDGVGFWNPANCNVRFCNSNIGTLSLKFDRDCSLKIADIKPDFYDYLDLREKVNMISGTPFSVILNRSRVYCWSLEFYYDSDTTVQDSTIIRLAIAVQGISAYLQDLKPQYYEYGQTGKIKLNHTSIEGPPEGHLGDIIIRAMDNSEVTVLNSAVGLAATSNSIVRVIDSLVSVIPYAFFGILNFERANCSEIFPSGSGFYIQGNVSFPGSKLIAWFHSNVTRNYGVTVWNGSGSPVSNVALALVSRDDMPVWNGTTDDEGRADFNLTFADNNYTDTLKLEAVKGNYSALANVTFLSDTPIVLKMRYFPDLNKDGTVNILDMSIVAKAFGSKLGDPNWNAMADLNNDGIINILDISLVAKDYGKTV